MSDRLSDLALERDVLGSCLLNPALLSTLAVSHGDFYSVGHQTIWAALCDLHEIGDGVDTVRLRSRLSELGKLESVGGEEYLLSLTDLVPLPDPPVERLRQLARLRALHAAATDAVAKASQGDLHGAAEALDQAQRSALDANEGGTVTGFDCAVKTLEDITQSSTRVMRVHPGLEMLANAVGDLPVGSLTVVGGATNTGKSSFCLEMLLAAVERNVAVGYVSREDPDAIVGARLIASLSGVSSRAIHKRAIEPDRDWPLISTACGRLKNYGELFLVDTQVGGTELDVCAAMTRMAQRGAKLVCVDYVQTIDCSKRQQDRRNEIRWLTSKLKAHAVRLGVALVLVSQLSRPPKGDENKEPSKHDLKEAGDVENAAEVIVLIWRETEGDFEPLKVKIAKCKWGGVGQSWAMVRSRRTGRLEEMRD